MDRDDFDALARLVSTKQSRRSAVVALLGATVLGHDPDATLAKDKQKVKAAAKAKAKNKPCYPGTSCIPGKGRNTSGCDFSNSTHFKNKDVRGANLSNSNFFAADLEGADFRGANLSGSCFVAASLLNAKMGSSVNLGNAIFCHTLMPDGSFNMSGCDQTTACCPACPGGACIFEGCTPLENICIPMPPARPCCPNTKCVRLVQVNFFTGNTCQSQGCSTNAECQTRFPGQDVICKSDCGLLHPGSCCLPKPCAADHDCPHGGRCCCFFGDCRCCVAGQICTPTGCYGGVGA